MGVWEAIKWGLGPEKDPELIIITAMEKQLELGVNKPGMMLAFDEAREVNRKKNLGLTNNHLLNLLSDTAKRKAKMGVENVMYGGEKETLENIAAEIQSLRQNLTDEEKRT